MVYRPNGDGSFSKPEMVNIPTDNGSLSKPETETEEKSSTRKVVEAAVTVVGTVVAVAGMVAWGVSLFSSEAESSDEGKQMKRPGENGYIERAVFESDPKGYFQNHRQNKR
ncbi:hypothetical protein POM88_054616 [Heracleum sosnowskyi]|uniref:Uncharacterized protein n=1 Tax=Heracleum sosnowskyi TaxID=360622 RepID=A0AAD8GMF1_9APIA|nr:hypothetical protein POM88_054616 [Heracleum sosnowskyi]